MNDPSDGSSIPTSERENYEVARFAVCQDQWNSVGISSSGQYLQMLFGDDGSPLANARPKKAPLLNWPLNRDSMLLPSQNHFDASQVETPSPLLSHGLFRMSQSNADPDSLHDHFKFTDLSDPPNLYASLHEEQLPPPLEDMNPSDPDLIPHEQELRFEGDLYTPR
jgi:hypothetical protein